MIIAMNPTRRRTMWLIIGVIAVLAGLTLTLLFALTRQPHPRPKHISSSTTATPAASSSTPSPAGSPANIAALPVTDDPGSYADAVAERLFDVEPAAVSRQQFLNFWEQNLPTVVYSDAASKGLTLPEQNADAIDSLTHAWIPTDAGWKAEAASGTVGQLTITSTSVPDYWINAVASGRFVDPGLHMERVLGILGQTYGISSRYTTRRAVAIDIGLLCGPTQPGGCRLLAPQVPPDQGGTLS